MNSSERLLEWLSIRPDSPELIHISKKFFAFEIYWTISTSIALSMVLGDPELYSLRPEDAQNTTSTLLSLRMLPLLIVFVFIEEVIFRFIPLTAVLVVARFVGPVRMLILPAIVLRAFCSDWHTY